MQSGESHRLDTCSPAVRKGLEFLDNWFSKAESYYVYDGIAFYLLNKVECNRVSDFIAATRTEEFWEDDIHEYYQEVYHICLLYSERGLDWRENEYLVSSFKEYAMVNQDGEGIFGMLPQGSALRPLSLILPDDERTSMAISYFEDHFEELYPPDMATGLLALAEFHPSQYRDTLNRGLEMLEEEFEHEIGFEEDSYDSTGWDALGLLALVRLSNNFSPERAVKWLEERQNDNGSWGKGKIRRSTTTALVLLVLFAAGEGPKTPRNPVEWKNRRLRLQEGTLPLVPVSKPLETERQNEYIERLYRLSPVVFVGVIAVESAVILSLLLIYDSSIFYTLPALLMAVVTAAASLFTIIGEWDNVSEWVQERL